jgi:hypothetical protein
MAVAVEFAVSSNTTAEIIVVKAPLPEGFGGNWAENENFPDSGKGVLMISSGIAGNTPSRSNQLRHVVLHELGHALDHSHVLPATAGGACTIRDSAMYDRDGNTSLPAVGPLGPFSGLTCGDLESVGTVR